MKSVGLGFAVMIGTLFGIALIAGTAIVIYLFPPLILVAVLAGVVVGALDFASDYMERSK